jgi:phage gp16-like protein
MANTARKASDRFRGDELAKIHIARKDLALTEEIYRDIIREASGGKTESSGELNWRGRRAVLERFRELGWKPRHAGKKAGQRPSRPLADYPEAKMIRGLWIELHQLHQAGAAKAVRDSSEKALNSFVKRMTGIDDLHWLQRRGRVDHIIEALKAWVDRSRQDCFVAWWKANHTDVRLDEPLTALLLHAACSLDTGATPDAEWRPVLGEGGWHLLTAYAGHLQAVVQRTIHGQ